MFFIGFDTLIDREFHHFSFSISTRFSPVFVFLPDHFLKKSIKRNYKGYFENLNSIRFSLKSTIKNNG